MSAVTVEGISKVFGDGTRAVDNVSLSVSDGELMVLLGPSGCGKSTLLRMIAGLTDPTEGSVIFNEQVVNELSPGERKIAMVFQDLALYPHLTVAENIGFPLLMAGVTEEERAERVTNVAGALGIGHLLVRKPSQLSGGQRQRVAMGRAIVRRPRVFLMDEPLSNLDAGLRSELRQEIVNLVRELGVTTIYVTHDQTEALTMADRVAILRDGVLQDLGTPSQVYRKPATAYVAAFLGNPKINMVEAAVEVHLDQRVLLHIGDQRLTLPWSDHRARSVSRFHRETIALGIRAEALTPVPPGTSGDVLNGTVRYLEHHGHETFVFLDTTALVPVVDGINPPEAAATPPPAGLSAVRRARELLRSVRNGHRPGPLPTLARHAAGEGVAADRGRPRRRRAQLAVRLPAYPTLRFGQAASVAVRMDLVHFFDEKGRRIDVGVR